MPKATPSPTLVLQLTPAALAELFAEGPLAEGREAVAAGRVSRPTLRPTHADAVVAGADRLLHHTRLAWSSQGLGTACSCGESRCAHGAALGLVLLGEVSTAPEVEAAGLGARDAELRRREARGASDLFEVRRQPGQPAGLTGGWLVSSPSARAYRVVLRSLVERHNGCTCPDFATNLLGTCKHVEAVLHRLRTDAPRRWARAVEEGPAAGYLHLAFTPEATVGLRPAPGGGAPGRRLAEAFFGRDGTLAAPLEVAWSALEAAAREAGLEVPDEVAALGARAVEAAELERRRREVEAEVRAAGPLPPGLRRRLYPYQVEGVAFLASRGRALLADEMGLGKTAQAIAALVHLARRGEVRRTVVVCPASLKHQWQRELLEFAGLGPADVAVVGGARAARLATYAAAPPVLVTSYELVRADARELSALAPDLLVLDEAQRIKNWRTRTAAVVKGLTSRFAFVLTGTPLENRLDDLYSLMQVVDPHRFGPLWRFNEEFTRLDEAGRPVGYRGLDRLRERLAPVALRRRKEEVLTDLPARLVSRRVVPMGAAQVALHAEADESAARLLAAARQRPLTPSEEQRLLRAFQRMRLASDAAGLVDGVTEGAPKLEELERLLEELCLAGGRKVVVFSEWERMQAMAAEVCQRLGVGHVRLHGGVPAAARGALVDRFREDPACQVFLSTDAGGVGLNLQAASHVVNLDLPWTPAVLAQRIARVHRLGQREPVNVVLLVSEGSFEERLEASLTGKRALFEAAVGDDTETSDLELATLARRLATTLGGEFAAATGRPDGAAPALRVVPPVRRPPPAALGPLAALAARKRAAAVALARAGQAAEALPLFHAAMALACRARDPRGDPGADPAALLAALHGHLVPAGLVTEAEAAALARAGEAARAFGASTLEPPAALVAAITADAAALVERAAQAPVVAGAGAAGQQAAHG
ncbi:MAG: DEAD/DEAH box helicase [Anaeromyxobacter sp.]|nr:DEAD/DEAH box helicase [Anaeromyxobacter sp.]